MAPSVALLHDYLLVRRGAERSFEAIADSWPEAPIYTLLYDESAFDEKFAGHQVHTSRLQHLPLDQGNFRRALPLFSRAVRSLPLAEYDLVISSSSAFAHMALARPDATHVCYCYSPFRYAWYEEERALQEVAAPLRPLLRRTLAGIRTDDLAAARRVSRYVAISATSRKRILDCWGRSAEIVHPPVEVERFHPRRGAPEFDLLIVTELVRHKRVEVGLEAARRAGMSLRVVGEGPDRERLEAEYGGEGGAEFLGRVDDEELVALLARARAFLMPNIEEFGIAAVEAMASGVPVVAAASGGALETVVDGETGVLVSPPDAEGFAAALARTDLDAFDPETIARNAARFSRQTFQERLREQVEAAA